MPPVTPKDAQDPFILTIDAGTSSARALLYDARGRAVEGLVAQERYSIHSSADGAVEDDPDAALERIWRCVDAALAQAGPLASQIRGVAVDTLVSNILPIDAAGQPLAPLITYADTRNDADATELRRALDERAVQQRTGCLLRTSYWPARLAWFRRTLPEIWCSTARWITLGEYLELRLFGCCRAGSSVASWSGLLDCQRIEWDAPLLGVLGISADQLSPLADASEPLSGLANSFASRWPALRDVPWFPAIGDGAAANLGSGCTGPDRLALTVGTTGAMRVVQPQVAEVPAGLWCYRVDRRRALLGGATSEGGNVYAWMQDTLKLSGAEATERALADLPPDGHGLTVLPFLAGERSPGWAGDVRATISGLGLNTTPIEILRAGLEAVAYRFALIFERLEAGGLSNGAGSPNPAASRQPPASAIIASGGSLLSSPTWLQIIADTLGHPILASDEPEATSRGTALLALESLGVIGSIDELPASTSATYQPNAANHEIYRAAIDRQRELYRQLIGEEGTGAST
ncbi:MAG TPA: gluconokinase [Roseiflexaceae bacterium]|nr:gluconokinase [Roseiflexaceae bacterium]